ncbi:hypothetical protein [Streptomyces sp. WM6386]|uniref:hypothetical protein n=1 Tax=Streptomyces sp. WM6386 TaxID=1415558 RepID=UPI003B6333B5
MLVEREPQFMSLATDHPATSKPVVDLADLAQDRWMIDPTVDGWGRPLWGRTPHTGCSGPRGSTPVSCTAITTRPPPWSPPARSSPSASRPVCPAPPRPEMAVRRLRGDPPPEGAPGVRLLLAARNETDLDGAHPALEEAYWGAARQAPAYREWLERAVPATH